MQPSRLSSYPSQEVQAMLDEHDMINNLYRTMSFFCKICTIALAALGFYTLMDSQKDFFGTAIGPTIGFTLGLSIAFLKQRSYTRQDAFNGVLGSLFLACVGSRLEQINSSGFELGNFFWIATFLGASLYTIRFNQIENDPLGID